MPMKELLHRLQPVQVYIVLVLSVFYFMVQMFISQRSQSITLLVHTYHMLCNIIALSGCIITIKQNNNHETKRLSRTSEDSSAGFDNEDQKQKEIVTKHLSEKNKQQHQHEKSLKNTFGWMRVDVLTMVIVCTFLTSFCFSTVVEVIQTLFHIEHKDHVGHIEEYHEYTFETCIILGALGLVLNGISYLLIGGYTYHQGSFLHLTADGSVYILDRVVTDGRKISDSEVKTDRKSQKIHELSRDVCSCFVVIVCSSIIVFCKDNQSASVRLVDPMLALVSIAILMSLSYPYMKEAAQILLQTIPDSIDIEVFQKELLEKFPDIQSIHDLHIWQLTQQKFVSTAHIIFLDPKVYKTTINDVIAFFHEQGINIVTIQPEFKNLGDESQFEEIKSVIEPVRDLCLVACREPTCEEKLCCQRKSAEYDSDESLDKSKNNIQLEQVISVTNISAEELTTLSTCVSAKSLDYPESSEESSKTDVNNKRSSASLYNPSTSRKKYKLQKAISAIDRDHQVQSTAVSTCDGINLVSIKKFVSESVIKTGSDHDHRRQNSDILVENRMQKQLNTTDNTAMEDLYNKCDKEM